MKTAVISGGSKGIGRAIVERFAMEGFTIFTCARNNTDLESLKKSIETTYGVLCHVFVADLSKREETKAFGNFVNCHVSNVDVLVNNAGYFVPGDIHSEEDGMLESMIESNLYSAYYLSRTILPGMIAHKSGHLFNICSIASIAAYDNGGSYSVSKYAMYGMTRNLREEMKDKGVRVTAILPGATFSASWDGIDISEDRLMKASDIAETVWCAFSLSKRAVVEDIVIRPQLGDL